MVITQRSAQAADAFTMLDGLKTPMVDQFATNGTFLIEGNPGVAIGAGVNAVTSGRYVASVISTSNPALPTADHTSIVATYKSVDVSPTIAQSRWYGRRSSPYVLQSSGWSLELCKRWSRADRCPAFSGGCSSLAHVLQVCPQRFCLNPANNLSSKIVPYS